MEQGMTTKHKLWTDGFALSNLETMIPTVCESFSRFPFMLHNKLLMQVNMQGKVHCITHMSDHLVGNVLYGILHGGVTATMLDSIGGLQTMVALFEQIEQTTQSQSKNKQEYFEAIKQKVGRVATTDFRVDYLTAGRGKHFIATAKVVRLGSRHSTCQMQLVNDENELIAVATGSYAY